MACRRCSVCGIDFPIDETESSGRCLVSGCFEILSYFADCDPHEDWRERLGAATWRSTGSDYRLYGGATAISWFEHVLDSIIGVDDFILECGEYPAPTGNE